LLIILLTNHRYTTTENEHSGNTHYTNNVVRHTRVIQKEHNKLYNIYNK